MALTRTQPLISLAINLTENPFGFKELTRPLRPCRCIFFLTACGLRCYFSQPLSCRNGGMATTVGIVWVFLVGIHGNLVDKPKWKVRNLSVKFLLFPVPLLRRCLPISSPLRWSDERRRQLAGVRQGLLKVRQRSTSFNPLRRNQSQHLKRIPPDHHRLQLLVYKNSTH